MGYEAENPQFPNAESLIIFVPGAADLLKSFGPVDGFRYVMVLHMNKWGMEPPRQNPSRERLRRRYDQLWEQAKAAEKEGAPDAP